MGALRGRFESEFAIQVCYVAGSSTLFWTSSPWDDPTEELLPSATGGAGQMKKRAYTALKRLLVSRSVAPGTFLSVRQLAKQLEMSSTPIRAALERLEAEGFITISPQQGIVVRELS